MEKRTIFDDDLEKRKKDQETIRANIGIESKNVPDRISLSLPSDCKQIFLEYCEKNYITPSAQLRVWIAQNCND